MLAELAGVLVCPVCGADVRVEVGTLRCASAHAFDIARQGYVNLLAGSGPPGSADTAEMVAAREHFLVAGHLDAISRAVADEAAALLGEAAAGAAEEDQEAGPLVVEAGAGTGYYLGAALDRLPAARGLALDASKHAARRAARAHPRAASAVCDVWKGLPVRSGAAALVLDVFSPRNPAEFRRVLEPSGALLVVTPLPGHLAELVSELGLLEVDRRKEERLEDALAAGFRLERRREHTARLELPQADAEAAARMGPSARHLAEADLRDRVAALANPVRTTAAFALSAYRPR